MNAKKARREKSRKRGHRDSGPPDWRSFVAAALTGAVLVSLALTPTYRKRLGRAYQQLGLLSLRATKSLEEVELSLMGAPYDFLRTVRSLTFEDAVFLISDDPRDEQLSNRLWVAYYLYPRVVVNPKLVDENPDLNVDFLLATRNFHPGIPDGETPERFRMSPLSARAEEHLRDRKHP